MAVFKDKWNGYNSGSWRVSVYYKDWKGEQKRHDKRGLKQKRKQLHMNGSFWQETIRISIWDLKPLLISIWGI